MAASSASCVASSSNMPKLPEKPHQPLSFKFPHRYYRKKSTVLCTFKVACLAVTLTLLCVKGTGQMLHEKTPESFHGTSGLSSTSCPATHQPFFMARIEFCTVVCCVLNVIGTMFFATKVCNVYVSHCPPICGSFSNEFTRSTSSQ